MGRPSTVSDLREIHLDPDSPRDARSLLGMHTIGAKIVVGLYLSLAAFAILAITPKTIGQITAMVVALAVLGVATAGIITVPGDPLPTSAAIPMAAAGAVAAGIGLAVLDPATPAAILNWIHGLGTAVLCFMCVRGRTLPAWCGMGLMVGVYAVGAAVGPERVGVGPLVTIIDLAPLSMATVFSLTLRPSAKMIFDLRETGARRAAELAARTAAAAEREAQLTELDLLARPMLDRIAAGAELTAAERETCELLEAHLRDRLRAPGLATTAVTDAARSARSRGVEVILIDDGLAAPASVEALTKIRAEVVNVLDAAASGDVRVRLLPPNRAATATVVVRGADGMFRREFDRYGNVMSRTAPETNP